MIDWFSAVARCAHAYGKMMRQTAKIDAKTSDVPRSTAVTDAQTQRFPS
jgi:hypothetical protein